MSARRALGALVLAACAASPRPSSPLRPFYVPPSAPACAEDEGELGAAVAAMRFDEGEGDAVLTAARSVLVRAAYDCSIATRARTLRLTSSESFAEGCVPHGPDDACAYVRTCWALGGPADRACDASVQSYVHELSELIDDEGPHLPGVVDRDPAGRPDAPTIYVETGTSFYGQGHLVQRVEGAWRVVVSALVWQS